MVTTSESGAWDQDPPGSGRAGSTIAKRTPNVKQAAKAKVVRDDWDDDDDDDEEEPEGDASGNAKAKPSETKDEGAGSGLGFEEEGGEEDSSKIWEEANKRVPMPELIVALASTSQSLPPPPAALQPTLRILKRPSPNTNAGGGPGTSASLVSFPGPTPGSGSRSSGTPPAPRGTLAEREAQYQEARSRIFGEKDKVGGSSVPGSGAMSMTSSSSGGVVVMRDPLGPASEPGMEPGVDKAHGPDRPAKGFGEGRRGKT